MGGPGGEGPAFNERPAQPRRRTFGRRQGRRLRPGQQALLRDLLPRLEIDLPDDGRALDLAALFGRSPERVNLEIGFGSGEHLAWQAARDPAAGFIGAEVFLNGVVGLLRLAGNGGLENLRIHHGDALGLIAALPEASLDRVFILFPDPWPKLRHHKRRLVQPEVLDRLAAIMKDGAELRMATDHGEYLRWSLARLTGHPDFDWLARRPGDWRERPADWPATRYEMKALGEGRRPAFLRFRRRARAGTTGAPEQSG